ncbi:hypothetical protein [Zavarzinella formosa]|uniref:hypothetical protein n=1 Tax=Zavarzinella formosa TaxID=360055 RepID=UPI0002D7DE31|nr:hypothetical protein [Zavarzinella formosa]
MRTIIAAGLLLAGLSISPKVSRADIPPPVPEPKSIPVKIYLDEKAKESRILVPQNLTTVRFRPVRPGLPPNAGNVPPPTSPLPTSPAPGSAPPKADIDTDTPVSQIEADVEYAAEPIKNPNHLMIAGVALTMGLGCGGVWLLRRPDASTLRGVVLLVASGVVLCGSTLLWANAPPPVRPPVVGKIDLPILSDGKMKLEVLQGGDTISIILDKETYAKLQKEAK